MKTTSLGPVDWLSPSSQTNSLLLNPRLPADTNRLFNDTWNSLVEGHFQDHIGIATSGSSGTSFGSFGKLILLSRHAFLASARAVNQHLQSTEQDVWFKALPDFHVGGLSIYARAALTEAVVFDSASTGHVWDPQSFYEELVQSKATLLSLVPTQLFDLVTRGYKSPAALRAVVIGGASLDESLRVEARALGWPVLASYGMTECCSQIATALHPDTPDMALLSHVEVQMGQVESDDQAGPIEVKSAALFTAMIEFDALGKAHLSDPKNNGWFVAQDRGRVENSSDGVSLLRVLGRNQDFIKIGGEGVVVSRLEGTIQELKLKLGIQSDVALLSAADERLGAKLILLATSIEDGDKLSDAFNKAVLPFEKIRFVYQVKALPRSELGKLLRSEALRLVDLKAPSNLER